jgi:uncharacterized beta-barrel protein YwiB (DUF1934 family)
MLEKQDVRIFIETQRQGLTVSLFEEEGGAEELDEDALEESAAEAAADEETDGADESEIMMEGRLVQTTHRVELTYEESELTGMEGSKTKIGFDRACPELISMLRSGPVNTALIFEPLKRHVCVYNTPFSSFEVCVHTLRVENFLLERGELFVDYLIEIHGARTERCKMKITLR